MTIMTLHRILVACQDNKQFNPLLNGTFFYFERQDAITYSTTLYSIQIEGV